MAKKSGRAANLGKWLHPAKGGKKAPMTGMSAAVGVPGAVSPVGRTKNKTLSLPKIG